MPHALTTPRLTLREVAFAGLRHVLFGLRKGAL